MILWSVFALHIFGYVYIVRLVFSSEIKVQDCWSKFYIAILLFSWPIAFLVMAGDIAYDRIFNFTPDHKNEAPYVKDKKLSRTFR